MSIEKRLTPIQITPAMIDAGMRAGRRARAEGFHSVFAALSDGFRKSVKAAYASRLESAAARAAP